MPGDATIFHSTAPYYARHRPGYQEALFDHLVRAYALDAGTRVVDAGCGTGQVAIPLAKRGIPVLALDPDPDMLAETSAAARAAGVTKHVQLTQGRAEDLDRLARAPLRLVTFAASFHWTERDAVLALCDRLVDGEGGVAVISGGAATRPAWLDVVSATIEELLGPRRRAGTSGFYAHPEERHEAVLRRSAFARVETWRGGREIVRNANEVIGLQLSLSYCSPALLGARQADFERVLRERLVRLDPGERFVEAYEIVALCARRG